MKKAQFFSILLLVIFSFFSLISCNSTSITGPNLINFTPTPSTLPIPSHTNTPLPTPTSTPDYSNLKVLLFISGTLGDHSYFDLFTKGIQLAQQEYRFSLQTVESGWGAINYVGSFTETLANGTYDIVVAFGDAMRWSVETEAAKYPGTKFILLDGKVNSGLKNIFSGPVNKEKAAYIAGLYAGYMTSNTSLQGINADTKIGAIGISNDFVNNQVLMSFRKGAIDAGLKIKDVMIENVDALQKIKDSKRIATQMYLNGADIIFLFSDLADYGGAQAAFELGHYVIGMGKDYAGTLSYSNSQLTNNVLTSAVIKPDLIAYDAITKALDKTLPFGSMISYGINGGFVGLVKNENFEQLSPPDLKEKITLAEQELSKPKILFVMNNSWEDDLFSDFMRSNYEQAANNSNLQYSILQLDEINSDLESKWESVFVYNTFDVLITSGEEAVEHVTYYAQLFPNHKFILIGGKVDFFSNYLPNVYSASFRTNEAFYLAGMYASLMTKTSTISMINPDAIIGVVAGVDDKPYLDNRIKAFKQGATDAGLDANSILVNYSGGFFENQNAATAAGNIYNQKADMILNLSGPAGGGIIQSAQEEGFYMIEYTSGGNPAEINSNPDEAPFILTSVFENREKVMMDILTKIEKGEMIYGQLETLGLSTGMIGIDKSGNFERLTPESIKTEIENTEKKIIDHEIFILPEYIPGLYF